MGNAQGLKWTFGVDVTDMVAGFEQAKSGFKDVAAEARSSSDKVEKSTNKITSSFAKMGKIAGVFLGARALAKFTTQAIDAGGAMDKLRRISHGAFGELGDDVEAFARTSSKAYNLTEREMLSFINTMGIMYKGMGIANKEAVAMSMNMTKLASDMAYVHNTSPEEMFSKLQAAAAGTTQPLKRLGYDMGNANLQNYLYANGFDVLFSKLNESSQAMVRYNYLMEQTSGIQGQAAASLNSFGAATQYMRAQWDLFKTSAGEILTTVLLPMLRVIAQITAWFAAAAQAASHFVKALFGVEVAGQGLKPISTAVTNTGSGFGTLAKNAKKARQEISKLAGFDELNILPDDAQASSSGPAVPGMGGIGIDIGGVDYSELTKAGIEADKFRLKFEELANTIEEYKGPIAATIGGISGGLLALMGIKVFQWLSPMLAMWGDWILEMGFVKGTLDLVASTFSSIGTAIFSTVGLIIGAFVAVGAALGYLWVTNEEWRDKVIDAWNLVAEFLGVVWETVLQPIFENITKAFLFIWDYGIKPLWDGWVEFVRLASEAIMELWTAISPFVFWMVDLFGPPIVMILDYLGMTFAVIFAGIGQVVGFAFKFIGGIVSSGIGVLTGLITFITGIFSGDWSKAWSGVTAIFDKTFGKVFSIAKSVWNNILGLFANGGKIFSGFTSGVTAVFKNIVNTLVTGINKVIAIPFNSINAALNGFRSVSILGVKPFSFIKHNAVKVPQIPRFADGGIVSGRIIGEMGEYEGIRNNPEVIAPLDRLESMLSSATDPEQIELLREQIRLLRQLLDKDNNTYLDGRQVSRGLSAYDRRRLRLQGEAG